MNLSRPFLALSLVLLTAGCGGGEKDAPAVPEQEAAPTVQTQDVRVDKAVAVARALRDEPAREAEILREHGMTRAEFEDLLIEIASDGELSRSYRERMSQ